MTCYVAELDANNIVVRVLVCRTPEWPASTLGGTWAETADPYGPPSDLNYAGIGYGYATNLPQRFAPQWTSRAYEQGAVVWHGGRLWRSTATDNTEEPGTGSRWSDTPAGG